MQTIEAIKTELKKVFNAKQSTVLSKVIVEAYDELVKADDFNELKEIVERLAKAQERTEQRVEELADVQKGSEKRLTRLEVVVEELADVQKGSEKRLTRLEVVVEELADAQKETQKEVRNLAEAQKETEKEMRLGFKSLSEQISALGGRWGIYNEATFRSTLKGILGRQKGVEIKSGYYGNREVDVIIRNGEHILLEITSRLKTSDVDNLIASGDDYKGKHGIEPVLMIATSYISPILMQRILSHPRKIEIFSYEGEGG